MKSLRRVYLLMCFIMNYLLITILFHWPMEVHWPFTVHRYVTFDKLMSKVYSVNSKKLVKLTVLNGFFTFSPIRGCLEGIPF